jgi:hypothetical protein
LQLLSKRDQDYRKGIAMQLGRRTIFLNKHCYLQHRAAAAYVCERCEGVVTNAELEDMGLLKRKKEDPDDMVDYLFSTVGASYTRALAKAMTNKASQLRSLLNPAQYGKSPTVSLHLGKPQDFQGVKADLIIIDDVHGPVT